MTAPEMHVMFRQYAQQMGMQNVRAILPEQIDLLLNTSQMDAVNQIIKENIGITNDRVITDNSKIGQINALRSLYNVRIIDFMPGLNDKTKLLFNFSASDKLTGRITTQLAIDEVTIKMPSYMFLVDFSINYRQVQEGEGYTGIPEKYTTPYTNNDAIVTNYFPVRLIDDAYLADTLNDFILKNRLRSPIMVIYNNGVKQVFDLYIDKFNKVINRDGDARYCLDENLMPNTLRMSYIATPSNIEYKEDVGGTNKNCELPEYMHVDIVKHAVDLYRMALSGSIMSTQQQEQNQSRENTRNNYRNEGNSQS